MRRNPNGVSERRTKDWRTERQTMPQLRWRPDNTTIYILESYKEWLDLNRRILDSLVPFGGCMPPIVIPEKQAWFILVCNIYIYTV